MHAVNGFLLFYSKYNKILEIRVHVNFLFNVACLQTA